MKIVLSKLPESGWWKSGIPQYEDNPAMKKGQIPINSLLIKERDDLIKEKGTEGYYSATRSVTLEEAGSKPPKKQKKKKKKGGTRHKKGKSNNKTKKK